MLLTSASIPRRPRALPLKYLKFLYARYGDWYLAMAAYNCGEGAVDRAVERTGYADYWELLKRHALPRETSNYVPIIVAMTIMAKNPQRLRPGEHRGRSAGRVRLDPTYGIHQPGFDRRRNAPASIRNSRSQPSIPYFSGPRGFRPYMFRKAPRKRRRPPWKRFPQPTAMPGDCTMSNLVTLLRQLRAPTICRLNGLLP